MPIADLPQMFYIFSQPHAHSGRVNNMNGFSKDGGKRPSAAPAQIRLGAFFCTVVSFFGEITEKNDRFIYLP
jgi:hypothetical protein